MKDITLKVYQVNMHTYKA